MMATLSIAVCVFWSACLALPAAAADSLPPLPAGRAPRDLVELWGDYNPRREPLDTTVVRQWREGTATCRVVLFTAGTFKGRPARLAAFYAVPTGAQGRLPALLHLHGGGQSANLTTAVFLALNGYAALSLNWGGNAMEGAAPGEPNTDWGAVDATQRHNDHYSSLQPDDKTLDAVESPRNNNWFLLLLAARRALTFLEQQPEVDPNRLGVVGHSMGGKLTTDLAGIDERVKVAVPSCGGTGSAPDKLAAMPGSGLYGAESALHLATIDDRAYLPRIHCPILYLAPTNDFNGPLDSMVENWTQIGSREVRSAISPHLNHRHAKEFEVSGYLWLDHYLQGAPALPQTPVLTLELGTPDGVPRATLRPDRATEATRVGIYYSLDPHVLTRFWRSATVERQGDTWVASLPLLSTSQPLYVRADAYYPLKRAYQGYQWLEFKGTAECALSSTMLTRRPDELQAAQAKPTARREALIDDFASGWQDWYRLEWANPTAWEAATRKVKDPQWRGPDGARLAVDVRSAHDTVLAVRVRVNDWGAYPNQPSGEYAASRPVKGSDDWQTLRFGLEDFRPANERSGSHLAGWSYVTELELCGTAEVMEDQHRVTLGGLGWPAPREFRQLRWLAAQR